MESNVEWKEIDFGKGSLSGDFGCVVGVGVVWGYCLKCSILDNFGQNKFNRIPPLETIFGSLTLDFKAGHPKISDLERVDCIWGADGGRIDLLLVNDKIFNLFQSLAIHGRYLQFWLCFLTYSYFQMLKMEILWNQAQSGVDKSKRSLVMDGQEAAWDVLRQAPPLEQESSEPLYFLCLMEAWAGTEGSFGNGARGIMQIHCHEHPMQARCACGHPSSSGVTMSGTGGYLSCYSYLPHEGCLSSLLIDQTQRS